VEDLPEFNSSIEFNYQENKVAKHTEEEQKEWFDTQYQ